MFERQTVNGIDFVKLPHDSAVMRYSGGAAVMCCAVIRGLLVSGSADPGLALVKSVAGLEQAILNKELSPYVVAVPDTMETLPRRQATLIMAHELGHIQYKHMDRRLAAIAAGYSEKEMFAMADFQEWQADRFAMDKMQASPYEMKAALYAAASLVVKDTVTHMAHVAIEQPQRWAALNEY